MSTSPQRATSSTRSPRSPLAAAADAALESAHTPTAHTVSASANEPLAGDNATLDSVINSWGERTTREQLRWQLSAVNATLRGAQELGQAQAELSQQLLHSLERLGQQLQDARNLSDLATVQTSLAQTDFDGLLRLSRRLTELGTNQALQLWQEASSGLVRMQSTYWESALNWLQLQTHFGGDSEMLQAEVEHVLSPMAASPLMWPAQEATRQMAQMAANGWNDWLSWTGQFADAGRTLFNGGSQRGH